jgi:protein SCO1/2
MISLRLSIIVLAGLVVAVVAAGLYLLSPAPRPAAPGAEMAVAPGFSLGGSFDLVDHTGRTVTQEDFAGDYLLIYFGYTYCPDVCPTELGTMLAAVDLLGDKGRRVRPILITVDPARDTANALAQYVSLFDPRLVGLTGSEQQIATVTKAYRVFYAKAETGKHDDYLMDHSAFIYLMGPDGDFRAMFRHGAAPEPLAEALSRHIKG